ncbi:MAG TPA: helix-hairpin-helix domain-containing protein [Methylomirabilota bacterium]|jgi:DNA uptake protein ComE-like DNA-binding protein
MADKVRINLANARELLELPGIGPEEAEVIANFRAEHGPITDRAQLSRLLGHSPLSDALWQRVDFAAAETTAPEAPGA